MGNYKDLEIYQLAYKLAIKVHHASLKLPKFEKYEQWSLLCSFCLDTKRTKKVKASDYLEAQLVC